jgi:hypothetical protein
VATIKTYTPEQQAEWDAWVASRPPVIQRLATKYPPTKLYRINTGHRVVIYSYSEDGTVTVAVLGKYNAIAFERRVFGVKAGELVECDLPPPDEPVGAVIEDPEEAAEFAKAAFAAIQAGKRHELN